MESNSHLELNVTTRREVILAKEAFDIFQVTIIGLEPCWSDIGIINLGIKIAPSEDVETQISNKTKQYGYQSLTKSQVFDTEADVFIPVNEES